MKPCCLLRENAGGRDSRNRANWKVGDATWLIPIYVVLSIRSPKDESMSGLPGNITS
jgi:hypothetical protein